MGQLVPRDIKWALADLAVTLLALHYIPQKEALQNNIELDRNIVTGQDVVAHESEEKSREWN